MNQDATSRRRTPVHLWIVGILSLLWNSMGAYDYLGTQMWRESHLASMTPAMRAYIDAFPSWAIAAWAFGVWGAFAGSILLLMRSRWAVWAFAISILGLAGSTIYQFAISDGISVMGKGAASFNAVIWVVAIALLFYAVRQRQKGVLA